MLFGTLAVAIIAIVLSYFVYDKWIAKPDKQDGASTENNDDEQNQIMDRSKNSPNNVRSILLLI